MADSRRRQFHSCDPCRKGKRGCDAPENRAEIQFVSCSNCKKWKKECTFNWLSTNPTLKAKGAQEKRKRTKTAKAVTITDASTESATPDDSLGIPSIGSDLGLSVDGLSAPWFPVDIAEGEILGINANEPFDFPSSSSFYPSDHLPDPYAQSWLVPDMSLPGDWPASTVPLPGKSFSGGNLFPPETTISTFNDTLDLVQHLEDDPRFNPHPATFCIASNNAAKAFARTSMTRNLMRIYHDSMENALSCWLTEHNCPYSEPVSSPDPLSLLTSTANLPRQRKEWGANWSNRMCIRVCELDRASSSLRGRALSSEEDKTASRALHLAIAAFASQWTQHAQRGRGFSVPGSIDDDERAIRRDVWNEARHALENSSRVPSFRVIFANIIFSLTQKPLDKEGCCARGEGLRELLEDDSAPSFLEAANRQLYTFRHKFMRLQRRAARERQVDAVLSSPEHRSTLDLLFWLGVMFDTLSAAMYQRPLVVSDEDSQIVSILQPPPPPSPPDPVQINLDCWDIPSDPQIQVQPQLQATTLTIRPKRDVWGDFFLHAPSPQPTHLPPDHWPYTYTTAATLLSHATPVKVLLYRRITRLQTLLYRCSPPATLKSAIRDAIAVYNHWNATYAPFMADCIRWHSSLPSRIQSWYVILNGHWLLAVLLLADVIGEVAGYLHSPGEEWIGDRGSDRAEWNWEKGIAESLQRETTLSIGSLARASLQDVAHLMETEGRYHDCVSEVAFLVEPWTVVLVNCFARGGYVSASISGSSSSSVGGNSFARVHETGTGDDDEDVYRMNCKFCISALDYLARKSDMAFVVARDLRGLLEGRRSVCA
ncbi:hypothetical protein BJY04DRAFT_224643 [Aspergillus karnatakaensis]|uniref:Zn(II)2Cys6 transcription factor domain-containing protein n=1 Tax=Aspergillus karnatakaensis TaxID=1810916 RepID=UPI003CCD3867